MGTKMDSAKILHHFLSISVDDTFAQIRDFLKTEFPEQTVKVRSRKRVESYSRPITNYEVKVTDAQMLRYENKASCFGKSYDLLDDRCDKCGEKVICKKIAFGATPVMEEEVQVEKKEAKDILYVYNEGDKAKCPILFVAHVDTVRHSEVISPKVSKRKGEMVIHNSNGILGGDDRAGVAILFLLKNLYPEISMLFTNFEETGGLGARLFSENVNLTIDDFRLMVEFDRAGVNHYVTYNNLPEEMEKAIFDETGLNKNGGGSFSDVRILTSKYRIPSINVASGYYNAHSGDEYVSINDWWTAFGQGIKFVESASKFPLIENYSPEKPPAIFFKGKTLPQPSKKVMGTLNQLRTWEDFEIREILNFFPDLVKSLSSLETFGLELSKILCKVSGIRDESDKSEIYIKAINDPDILESIRLSIINAIISKILKTKE